MSASNAQLHPTTPAAGGPQRQLSAAAVRTTSAASANRRLVNSRAMNSADGRQSLSTPMTPSGGVDRRASISAGGAQQVMPNLDDGEEFVIMVSPIADAQQAAQQQLSPSGDNSNAMAAVALLSGGETSGNNSQNALNSQQEHGGLVRKILETNKALTGGTNANQQQQKDQAAGGKAKEKAALKQQIEDLRHSIQELCRNTAPIGRIFDYFQEDLDSMNKEMMLWKEEEKRYAAQLEVEKK